MISERMIYMKIITMENNLYHEKFQGGAPPMDALFVKIFQGAVAAGVCFFIMALVSSILFRCYTIFRA